MMYYDVLFSYNVYDELRCIYVYIHIISTVYNIYIYICTYAISTAYIYILVSYIYIYT